MKRKMYVAMFCYSKTPVFVYTYACDDAEQILSKLSTFLTDNKKLQYAIYNHIRIYQVQRLNCCVANMVLALSNISTASHSIELEDVTARLVYTVDVYNR